MGRPTSGPYYSEPGRSRFFGKLRTWAEDGLIFCEWQGDGDGSKKTAGDAEVLDIQTARNWVKSFIKDLEHWDRAREGAPSPKDRAYAIEYFHTLKGQIQVLSETIEDAINQGDQTNDEVRMKKLRLFLRGRRACLGTTSGIPDTNKQIEALFYPGMNNKPVIFLPSSPVAVIPPELPANWQKPTV